MIKKIVIGAALLLGLPLPGSADDELKLHGEAWLLAKYDVNGDSIISENEVAIKRQQLFSRMDLNTDGGVSFNEYESLDIAKRQTLLKARFNKLDLDKDGRLSGKEYSSYLGSFDRFDQNNDGNITAGEIDGGKPMVNQANAGSKSAGRGEGQYCLAWFCVRTSIH